MLSFCITNKNRSIWKIKNGTELRLLPKLLESIVKVAGDIKGGCEVIISDWESTDWPLHEWVPNVLKDIPYKIVVAKDPAGFSRGKGLNIAAHHAKGDFLFFLDTDMLIEDCQFINNGISHAKNGKAYFPVCKSYKDIKHSEANWRITGYGMLLVSKEVYANLGPWMVKYSWGQEDYDIKDRCKQKGISIVRENAEGLFHQWHPSQSMPRKKQQVIDKQRRNKVAQQNKKLAGKDAVRRKLKNLSTEKNALKQQVDKLQVKMANIKKRIVDIDAEVSKLGKELGK